MSVWAVYSREGESVSRHQFVLLWLYVALISSSPPHVFYHRPVSVCEEEMKREWGAVAIDCPPEWDLSNIQEGCTVNRCT